MQNVRTVRILGVDFAALTFNEALALLEAHIAAAANLVVVTPNPEGVMQARRNAGFARAVRGAGLRLADGTGIVLAARYRRTPLPERVRGFDLTLALFERLSKARTAQAGAPFTAYFLGAAPGRGPNEPPVAERAKQRMEKRFPGLRVVGARHGYFTPDSAEEEEILADIREKRPDILLVCTGMPRAEMWAHKHRHLPVGVTLCVGGTLDIMGGAVKPAPAALRRVGLEWLYRLLTQPSRARRMLDIPRFIWAVIRSKP